MPVSVNTHEHVVCLCMQVAKVLVLLHNELLQGITTNLDSLRQAAATQAALSIREIVSP